MSLDDDVRDELRRLEAEHRLRLPRVVDSAQGPPVMLDGIEVLNLASNDYLSLAGDRRIARAAASSLDEDGAGAGASRLIVGNHRKHVVLERALADWLRCAGVRLFNSGYAAAARPAAPSQRSLPDEVGRSRCSRWIGTRASTSASRCCP